MTIIVHIAHGSTEHCNCIIDCRDEVETRRTQLEKLYPPSSYDIKVDHRLNAQHRLADYEITIYRRD